MEKRNKIIYWVATALLSLGMLGSGIQQVLRTKQMVDLVTPLGYPVYLLSIIGVWKILAVVAILMPRFKLLKEWAYAGLFFTMTGALISHLAVGDNGIKELAGPVMQTVFIILSWYFRPADRKMVFVN
jgi:uncharacterized membrane protein